MLSAAWLQPRDAESQARPATPSPASQPPFILFSTNSLSYLVGFNWDTPFAPSSIRDVITFEHFNANQFGDVFFFTDVAHLATYGSGAPGAGVDVYGELFVRLSSQKVFRSRLNLGPIKDLLYAGTFEFGRSGSLARLNDEFGSDLATVHLAHLHGVAIDVDVPGFQFASLNAFWRDDLDLPGSTYQLTGVWQLPIALGHLDLLFAGFFDFAGAEADTAASFHAAPQLLLGKSLRGFLSSAHLGLELEIWINEFGVQDQDDVVPQLMVRANF